MNTQRRYGAALALGGAACDPGLGSDRCAGPGAAGPGGRPAEPGGAGGQPAERAGLRRRLGPRLLGDGDAAWTQVTAASIRGHLACCRQAAMNTRLRSTTAGTRTTAPAARPTARTSRSTWLRRPTSSSTTTTSAIGSPATRTASSPWRPATSRANWAAPATGIPVVCARGCRTPTATAPTPSPPVRCRPGSYEGKVALNESWDVNYGAGGVQNGANIPFTVTNQGDKVTFSWDSATKVLTIAVDSLPPVDLASHRPAARAQPDPGRRLLLRHAGPLRQRQPGQRHGRTERRPSRHRPGPHRQGLLPRRRPGRPHLQAGLPGQHGCHRHLDDAGLQEQAGAGLRRGRLRRLSRLLDHGLHPVRPALRHQRRAAGADRPGPRQGDQGLLRHRHQPHGRRHPVCREPVSSTARRPTTPTATPTGCPSTTATTPARPTSRRWIRRRASRTHPSCRPPRPPSRCRRG